MKPLHISNWILIKIKKDIVKLKFINTCIIPIKVQVTNAGHSFYLAIIKIHYIY